MVEEWRDVAGFEGKYQVSNLGRVKRLPYRRKVHKNGATCLVSGMETKGYLDTTGYRKVSMGRTAAKHVHRLVCAAFHGPPPEGKPNVAHFDGDKENNRAENLRWADWADNGRDAARLLEMAHGEAHVGAVLSEADVIEIRRLHEIDRRSMRSIGREYGLCHQHVSDIVRRRTWKHI